MEEFIINRDATLPMLKIELINDGRYDFNEFYKKIQNSTITFSMVNKDNGVLKVSNQPAYVYPMNSCEEKYILYYPWKLRDTKLKGVFSGKFTITFSEIFGGGTLKVPLEDELIIYVQ